MVLDPTSTNWTTTLSYGSTTVVDVLPIGMSSLATDVSRTNIVNKATKT